MFRQDYPGSKIKPWNCTRGVKNEAGSNSLKKSSKNV
jgi:hypothetical protein